MTSVVMLKNQVGACQLILVALVNSYGNGLSGKDLKVADKPQARDDFQKLVLDKLAKYLMMLLPMIRSYQTLWLIGN